MLHLSVSVFHSRGSSGPEIDKEVAFPTIKQGYLQDKIPTSLPRSIEKSSAKFQSKAFKFR